MNITLSRIADTPFGVFGYLDLPGLRLCTLEEDWLHNRPAESCIPHGIYHCARSTWFKHGIPTFEITQVAGGRSRILFHTGNTEEDSKGCVILGKDFGAIAVGDEDAKGTPVRSKWAVTQSREAFKAFMQALDGVQGFSLSIRWCAPGEWRKG